MVNAQLRLRIAVVPRSMTGGEAPHSVEVMNATHEKRPLHPLRGLAMIALFFLANLIDWRPVIAGIGLTSEWAPFLVYTLLFVAAALLFGSYLRVELARLGQRIHRRTGRFIWALVGLTVAAYALNILTFAISANVFGDDGVPVNQELVGGFVDSIPAGLSLLMIAIFAPVIEELVFRESIIGIVKPKPILIWVMATISVLAFTFAHVTVLHEFWRYLPIALLLTGFYLRHDRNVWAPIAFHALYNFTGWLLLIAVPPA